MTHISQSFASSLEESCDALTYSSLLWLESTSKMSTTCNSIFPETAQPETGDDMTGLTEYYYEQVSINST